MGERIKFLEEVSKVEEKEGIKQRTVTEGDYRKYMKKFFGFDQKLLGEMKKAKEEFFNDLIKITGEDLVNSDDLKASEIKVRTESGRASVRFDREKTFQNPSTGQAFSKPSVTINMKVKSFINKEVLSELENQIKKTL